MAKVRREVTWQEVVCAAVGFFGWLFVPFLIHALGVALGWWQPGPIY